jgi:pimeloyl-ACP methyl ester carboxylesterase
MFRLTGQLCIAMIAFSLFTAAEAASAAAPFSLVPKSVESFDAGALHVDKFGSGAQALILIPGLACGSWEWYDTIANFSPHYTVYVITLPGFDGRAAANKTALFSAFARDFWEMTAAHKIETPVVVGHSLGGTLAIALAEQHPERLSGIVAVDGLPVFPMLANATPEQREIAAAQMTNTYAKLPKADEFAAQKGYMETVGTNNPDLVEPAARLEARSDPQAIAAWTHDDLTADLRPNLGRITIPFLEIMPYEPSDAKPPMAYTLEQTLAFYKSLVAGAPKVTVVAVAPARHFVMLDQPEAFYKAITNYLSSIHQ